MTPLLLVIEVARQTALLLLRNRLLLGLVALGLAIAAVVGVLPDRLFRSQVGEDLFGMPSYALLFQFALPLAGTYFGLGAIHSDLVDGSAAHVFAAPVPRVCLLLGRFLAVTLVVAVGALLVLSAYWLALVLPGHAWRSGFAPREATLLVYARGVALAVPAYAAVGVLLGAAFKRPLVAAIVFVVGWEVAVSNLPPEAGVRGLTIADPVRRFLLGLVPDQEGLRLHRMLEGSSHNRDISRLGEPVSSVLVFGAIALGLALWIYTRREYRLRSHADE